MNLTRVKKAIATCNDIDQLVALVDFVNKRRDIVRERHERIWKILLALPNGSIVYAHDRTRANHGTAKWWGKPLSTYRRGKARKWVWLRAPGDKNYSAVGKDLARLLQLSITPPIEAVREALES